MARFAARGKLLTTLAALLILPCAHFMAEGAAPKPAQGKSLDNLPGRMVLSCDFGPYIRPNTYVYQAAIAPSKLQGNEAATFRLYRMPEGEPRAACFDKGVLRWVEPAPAEPFAIVTYEVHYGPADADAPPAVAAPQGVDLTRDPTPNLLVNGGFEDGETGWKCYPDTNPDVRVEVTDQNSHSGKHSLRVKGGMAEQSLRMAVEPGALYYFEGCVWMENAEGEVPFLLWCYFDPPEKDPRANVGTPLIQTLDPGWQFGSMKVQAQPRATTAVLQLCSYMAPTSEFYVDDFVFRRWTLPQPSVTVGNPAP